MKTPIHSEKSGAILVIVMVVLVGFTLFVAAMLQLGSFNNRETEQQIRDAQAFWLAEAGLQASRADLQDDGNGYIEETATPAFDAGTGRAGTYEVIADGPNGFLSIGRLTVDGVTTERRIRFEVESIYEGYNDAIAAPNMTGNPWFMTLGGTGEPDKSSGFPTIPGPGDTAVGGRDMIYGNMTLGDGSMYMSGDSKIYAAIFPNTYGFNGDVIISDGTITLTDTASIAGGQITSAPVRPAPDLIGMDYPNTANYNLTEIFDSELGEGVSGLLPLGHPLRNVVRRSGNDYFFEPISDSGVSWDLILGEEKVYYADGDIWFDKNGPYQFDVDGTATIVASGNIHIGDGLRYESGPTGDDLVALIALGEYDAQGMIRDNTGNIYFGDPRFGTVYEMDAFMFAAHDFYYNLEENPLSNDTPSEPDTGFIVFGNFVALNQIHIDRDWYDPQEGGDARPTTFIPGTGWVDALSGDALTEVEINGGTYIYGPRKKDKRDLDPMRHYQLIVKYDERIHNPATHPPLLPLSGGGEGAASEDVKKWQHADI